LFAIQDELTDGIVGTLEPPHASRRQRARRKPPANVDAWDASLRGWWHYQRFTATSPPQYRRFAGPWSLMRVRRGHMVASRWCGCARALDEESAGRPCRGHDERSGCSAADPLDQAYAALGFVPALTGKHDEALAMCSKGINSTQASVRIPGLYLRAYALASRRQPSRPSIAIRISPNDVVLHVSLAFLSSGHYRHATMRSQQRSRALPYSAARTI
jgi:hypothetical protein